MRLPILPHDEAEPERHVSQGCSDPGWFLLCPCIARSELPLPFVRWPRVHHLSMCMQIAMGAFVSYFFSGFILGKIPFPLSPSFRLMLQVPPRPAPCHAQGSPMLIHPCFGMRSLPGHVCASTGQDLAWSLHADLHVH